MTKQSGFVGLGYVGLPQSLYRALHTDEVVVGYDIDTDKVNKVNNQQNPFNDKYIDDLFAKGARVHASTDPSRLDVANHFVIAVPTPITFEQGTRKIIGDYSLIEKAIANISPYVHKGDAILLVSTVGPGTCHEVVKPALEQRLADLGKNYEVGKEVFLIYSPETINPGDDTNTLDTLHHTVAAFSEEGLARGAQFLEQAYGSERVHRFKDVRAVELAKCLQNTYRAVNIALMNSLAKPCAQYGVDVLEVVEAAKTKGFAFQPHFPSRGVGGHCIPLDPYFVMEWAANVDIDLSLIERALKVNEDMPNYTVQHCLMESGIAELDTISVLGYSYKQNIGDPRETPVQGIVENLLHRHKNVRIYDPFVNEYPDKFKELVVPSLDDALHGADAAILATAHDVLVDGLVEKLQEHKVRLLVDGENAMTDIGVSDPGFVIRGIGR